METEISSINFILGMAFGLALIMVFLIGFFSDYKTLNKYALTTLVVFAIINTLTVLSPQNTFIEGYWAFILTMQFTIVFGPFVVRYLFEKFSKNNENET